MTRHIIKRLIESYFRHRWLYLLPVVLMAVIGGLSFYINWPKYISHGVVYIQKDSLLASLNSIGANNSNYWTTPSQATSQEINELIQTDAFIRAVIKQTDLEKKMGGGPVAVSNLIKDTRKNVWTFSLGDNQLQVNASDKNPQIATQLVNGVIESYIQWKQNGSRAQNEAAQGFFSDLVKSYTSDLDAARQAMKAYLVAHPLPIRGERTEIELLEIKSLQSDIDLASDRLTSALGKEENARLAQIQSESEARRTYLLVDAPQVPLKPETSLRQMALQFGIFIVVGLILSLTGVVGSAMLDRSFHFQEDVTNSLNLPVLALISDVRHNPRKAVKKAEREESGIAQPEREKLQGGQPAVHSRKPQIGTMTISKKQIRKADAQVNH